MAIPQRYHSRSMQRISGLVVLAFIRSYITAMQHNGMLEIYVTACLSLLQYVIGYAIVDHAIVRKPTIVGCTQYFI